MVPFYGSIAAEIALGYLFKAFLYLNDRNTYVLIEYHRQKEAYKYHKRCYCKYYYKVVRNVILHFLIGYKLCYVAVRSLERFAYKISISPIVVKVKYLCVS